MTPVAGQLVRFAVVGIVATLTHVAVAMCLVELAGVRAFWANFVAFGSAVSVSYTGNHYWTFARRTEHRRGLPRFVAVALFGLALNQAIVFAVVNVALWDYRIALAIVVAVVPALVFGMSRTWAFRPAERRIAATLAGSIGKSK